MHLLQGLPPFDPKSNALNVVIDTPKGCRNKFAYDKKRKAYTLKTVLPHGAVFPFDFGSISGTIGEDGDPLDALVLMDEPAFVGCLVESRVIGVIEANGSSQSLSSHTRMEELNRSMISIERCSRKSSISLFPIIKSAARNLNRSGAADRSGLVLLCKNARARANAAVKRSQNKSPPVSKPSVLHARFHLRH
jgi:hypothetical protein